MAQSLMKRLLSRSDSLPLRRHPLLWPRLTPRDRQRRSRDHPVGQGRCRAVAIGGQRAEARIDGRGTGFAVWQEREVIVVVVGTLGCRILHVFLLSAARLQPLQTLTQETLAILVAHPQRLRRAWAKSIHRGQRRWLQIGRMLQLGGK